MEFDFNCKSLVIGYDIEIFVFPFLVYNNDFFHQDGHAIFDAYLSFVFVYVITWKENLVLEYQFDFLTSNFVGPCVLAEALTVPENNINTYEEYDIYPS